MQKPAYRFFRQRRFYERCGGLFSDCEIIFETGSDSREFYFYLYPDMGEGAAVELHDAYYGKGQPAGKESAGKRLPLRRQERKFHLSELSVITIPQQCMRRRMECCIVSMSMNLMSVYLQMLKKFLPMNCRRTGRYG